MVVNPDDLPHFDEEVAAGAALGDPAEDEALRLECTRKFMRVVASNAIGSVMQRAEVDLEDHGVDETPESPSTEQTIDDHGVDKTPERPCATPSTEPPSRAESSLRAESATPSVDPSSRAASAMGVRAESSMSFVNKAGPLPEEAEEEEQEVLQAQYQKKMEAEQEAVALREALARETKKREAELWAQLCAKQFISQIVLGAVLKMPMVAAATTLTPTATVATAAPAPSGSVQAEDPVPHAETVADDTDGGAIPSAVPEFLDVDAIVERATQEEGVAYSSMDIPSNDQYMVQGVEETRELAELTVQAPSSQSKSESVSAKSSPIKSPAAKPKSSRISRPPNKEPDVPPGRRSSHRPKTRASMPPPQPGSSAEKRNTIPAGGVGPKFKAKVRSSATASPKRQASRQNSTRIPEEEEYHPETGEGEESLDPALMPSDPAESLTIDAEVDQGEVLQEVWEQEDQYATDDVGAYYSESQFSTGHPSMQFDYTTYAAPMPAWSTPRNQLQAGQEYALELDPSTLAVLLGNSGMSLDLSGLAFDAGSSGPSFLQADVDAGSCSQFYPGVRYEVADPARGAYDEQYGQWAQQQYQYQQQSQYMDWAQQYQQQYSQEQLQYMQQSQQQQQQDYDNDYEYDYDQQEDYLDEDYLQQKDEQQQQQVSEGTDATRELTLLKRVETPDGSEKAKDDKTKVDAGELRRAVNQRRRLGAKARQKKKTEDNDLFLVTTEAAAGGEVSRSSHPTTHDMAEGEEGEMDLSEYGEDAGTDYPVQPDSVASGAQLKSVRLLRELRITQTDAKVPSHNPDVNRPSGGKGDVYEPAKGIVPASSPSLTKPQAPPTMSPRRPRAKPKASEEWNESFTARAEQRIPVYDSLMDSHCTHLSRPEKLRHILRARSLPNQYLHIVRARFEQYRSQMRPNDTVGRRGPVPPGPLPDASANLIPSRLQERASNVQPGLEVTIPPNQQSSTTPVPLLCSPEWYNSPLHLFCERCSESANSANASASTVMGGQDPNATYNPGDGHEEQLDDAASQMVSQSSHAYSKDKLNELLDAPYQELMDLIHNVTSNPGDLGTCWMKVRQHLENLWQELQVSEPLQQEMRSRFLSYCCPDTYFSVLRHCRELVEFRAATLQIVSDVALRERLLEAASNTHALCLSDPRLEDLDAGLEQLNQMGTRIVRLICNWGRRYAHLFFDQEKSRRLSHRKEDDIGPVFVWAGRDYLEKVYSDGLALEHQYNGGSVLVKGMLQSRKFAVDDTLHDGPPPLWYNEKVAKEGVKMMARTKRGAGDLRFSINLPRSAR